MGLLVGPDHPATNEIDISSAPEGRMSPNRRRVARALGKWVDLAAVVLRLVAGVVLLVLAFIPRDTVTARVLEGLGGLGFLVWGVARFRRWRSIDWEAV